MIKNSVPILIMIIVSSCFQSKYKLTLENNFEKSLEIKFYFQKEERLKVSLPANGKISKTLLWDRGQRPTTIFNVSTDSIVYIYSDGKKFFQTCNGITFGLNTSAQCKFEKDLFYFQSGKCSASSTETSSCTITLDKSDYAKAN